MPKAPSTVLCNKEKTTDAEANKLRLMRDGRSAFPTSAGVVKLVYTHDSKSCAKSMRVRVPPPAPIQIFCELLSTLCQTIDEQKKQARWIFQPSRDFRLNTWVR